MDDDFIVAVYVVIDEIMAALGHRSHPLAGVSDAEVLTVAVVAAKHSQPERHNLRGHVTAFDPDAVAACLVNRFSMRLFMIGATGKSLGPHAFLFGPAVGT